MSRDATCFQLYSEFSREEFPIQQEMTLQDLLHYMMTWSASTKFCEREGITYAELRLKLLGLLGGEEEDKSWMFEWNNFTYCAVKPMPS